MNNYLLKYTSIILLFFIGNPMMAQVAINQSGEAPDSTAILDLSASDKGLLLPRLTTMQRDAIDEPAEGLMIYNSDDDCINYYARGSWFRSCGRDADLDIASQDPFRFRSNRQASVDDIAIDTDYNVLLGGKFSEDLILEEDTLSAFSMGASFPLNQYIAKLDADKNLLWWEVLTSSAVNVNINLDTDSAGNIYVFGILNGTADYKGTTLNPAGTSGTGFLLKLDPSGDLVWNREILPGQTAFTQGIVVNDQGGIYILFENSGPGTIGSTSFTSNGTTSLGIQKADSDGNWLWGKSIDSPNGLFAFSADHDDSGSLIVAGQMYGNTDFDGTILVDPTNGNADGMGFIVKYAEDGILQWANSIQSNDYNSFYDVDVLNDDAIYFTAEYGADITYGSVMETTSDFRFLVGQMNGNGEITDHIVVRAEAGQSVNGIPGINALSEDRVFLRSVGIRGGDTLFVGGDPIIQSVGSERFLVGLNDNLGVDWSFGASVPNTTNRSVDVKDAEIGRGSTLYLAGDISLPFEFGDISYTNVNSASIWLAVVQSNGNLLLPNSDIDLSQDNDSDPTNEIELPTGGTAGQILYSDGNGGSYWGDVPAPPPPSANAGSPSDELSQLRAENSALRDQLQRLEAIEAMLQRLNATQTTPTTSPLENNRK